MAKKISGYGQNYRKSPLLESQVNIDPLGQFQQWFSQAGKADLHEPEAMTLATADRNGNPSARMVLLKHFDASGFVFFTNYLSRKGQELSQNPRAALVFWWDRLERQVRIEGSIEKISERESDEYFASRPPGSQLAAWASQQSRTIPGPEYLAAQQALYEKKFQHRPVPRPDYWGGYRLSPGVIEFWQGRPDRLHDRLRYSLQADGKWQLQRLAP